MSQRTPSSVLALTGAGEPFRLLFPLGTALGIAGVSLWPLFAAGWLEVYPAVAHTRIMIQGFLGAFVVGFLGTALPRLLEVPRIGLGATLGFGACLVVLSGMHAVGLTVAGDALFLTVLTVFFVVLAERARQRKDTPPPGFVLVAMGMACAWAGTALLVVDGWGAALPASVYALARLFAWQGFLLLPVMGIGAFLLPRFFGLPNRHAFPELLMPTPEWKQRAAFAAGCGAAVLAGFVLEAFGWTRTGSGLRAVFVLVYFAREVPVHRARGVSGGLAVGLRLALVSVPLGYAVTAAFPAWQLAWVHIIFITGFSLLTFTVASRVLLGHSGQSHRFRDGHPAVLVLSGCFIAALVVRLAADFHADQRFLLYAVSGVVWVTGAVVWAAASLPAIRYADDE